jgi:hypothetical protein
MKSTPASAGAPSARRTDGDYNVLTAGKTWSRPLRGAPRDTTFVSFVVYGSQGTMFDIGGAKLTSQANAGTRVECRFVHPL